jgi:hypothetical protein
MPLTHITNSSPATRPAEMNHFSPLMIHWPATRIVLRGAGFAFRKELSYLS